MARSGVNIARVVGHEHGSIFAELVELLADALRQLGTSVHFTTNSLDADRLNVLIGATVFLPQEVFTEIRNSGARYIVFQTEALDERHGFAPHCPHYLDFLPTASQVWDYAASNLAFLEGLGCASIQHIPLGYAEPLERIRHATNKDIDVLFYGATTPRRLQVLEQLARRGWRTEVLFGVYGEERDRAIARAKILLNIHQFETLHLEQIRIAYLLNNRCCVVSECADIDPYDGGVVFCDHDKLVERCESLLAPGMERERERIAQTGYTTLKEIRTADSIHAALAMTR
jgi:hypothetical protein